MEDTNKTPENESPKPHTQTFLKSTGKMDKSRLLPSPPAALRRSRSDDVGRLSHMHHSYPDFVMRAPQTDPTFDSLFLDTPQPPPMRPMMRTRSALPYHEPPGFEPPFPIHPLEYDDPYTIALKRRTEADYLARELTSTIKVVNVMEHDQNELTRELSRLTMQHQESLSKVKNLQQNLERERSNKVQVETELKLQKQEWEKEREKLIQNAGGVLPPKLQENENLKHEIEELRKRNDVLKVMIDIIDCDLQKELHIIQKQLGSERNITENTQEHNKELERRLNELKEEKCNLELELKEEKEKETLGDPKIPENGLSKVYLEYPPESTVIQNLLQAQVEFYFSDYNLKRDKRLLEQVCRSNKGFLSLNEVMKLSRIRQLCSEKDQLVEALKRSKILTLNLEEGIVGRALFEKPREKEFPFRRTVFIFGIPQNEGEEFLKQMLQPFGNVSKIQFDHGPDTLDRRIGQKFLNKPRVYQLFSTHNRTVMIFRTRHTHKDLTHVRCMDCAKVKPAEEGFYEANGWSQLLCAQCAARNAEDQMNRYFNSGKFEGADKFFLGDSPRDINKRKTALVVFASQRQASKCAYVRSRIGYRGAFTTHFHHYSKVKKEIALNEYDNGRRQQPGLFRSTSHNHFSNNRGHVTTANGAIVVTGNATNSGRFGNSHKNSSNRYNKSRDVPRAPQLYRQSTAPVASSDRMRLQVRGTNNAQRGASSLRPPVNSNMRFARTNSPRGVSVSQHTLRRQKSAPQFQ